VSSFLPAAVVVTPAAVTPLIASMFATRVTPAVFSPLFAPDPSMLANLAAAMLIPPSLVVLGPVALPDLCLGLRNPCQQRQKKNYCNQYSLHRASPSPPPPR